MTIRAIFSLASKERRFLDLAIMLLRKNSIVIATNGTFNAIRDHQAYRAQFNRFLLPMHEITGFRETRDGAIKTLSPYLHAALQTRELQADVEGKLYPRIDLLCINFKKVDDVGGPAMVLSALKGNKMIIMKPEQCAIAAACLTESGGPPAALEELRVEAQRALHNYLCGKKPTNVIPLFPAKK